MKTAGINKVKAISRDFATIIAEILKNYDYATRIKIYERIKLETERIVEALTLEEKEAAYNLYLSKIMELKDELNKVSEELTKNGNDQTAVAKYSLLYRQITDLVKNPQFAGYVEDLKRAGKI